VSLNEIDDYNMVDMQQQLDFIYETRMHESGKSFIKKPSCDELELGKNLEKDFKNK
jgi:hypothetical protein